MKNAKKTYTVSGVLTIEIYNVEIVATSREDALDKFHDMAPGALFKLGDKETFTISDTDVIGCEGCAEGCAECTDIPA